MIIYLVRFEELPVPLKYQGPTQNSITRTLGHLKLNWLAIRFELCTAVLTNLLLAKNLQYNKPNSN